MPPSAYTIKIQADGDGKVCVASLFSEEIEYTQRDTFQVTEIKEDYLLYDVKVKC